MSARPKGKGSCPARKGSVAIVKRTRTCTALHGATGHYAYFMLVTAEACNVSGDILRWRDLQSGAFGRPEPSDVLYIATGISADAAKAACAGVEVDMLESLDALRSLLLPLRAERAS